MLRLKLCFSVCLAIAFLIVPSGYGQQPTWTRFSPSGSGPQSGGGYQSTAYDAATDRLIVFGGYNQNPCCGETNDVWILANASGTGGVPAWTQLTPTAPAGFPPARQSHSAVYDPATNRLIVFGGGRIGNGHFTTLLNDVWILTHANGMGGTPQWTQLNPSGGAPAAREGHAAVYNQATNEMFLYGGGDAGIMIVPGDLWVLENANGVGTPQWVLLPQAGATPGPLQNFAFAYDPASNRWTVVGGCCEPNYTNATRVLALNPTGTSQWTTPSPAGTPPSNGDGLVFGYNQLTGTLIVHGMQPGGGGNATLLLKNANGVGGAPAWTTLFPEGSPGAPPEGPAFVGTAYNAATNKLIDALKRVDAMGNLVPEVWVLSDADGSVNPPPPLTHILTVASTNPASGAAIIVSPTDNNGQGNGSTQFVRTYNDGAVVTLGAPATANGNNFSNWTGCDSMSGSSCTVTMTADRAVTAIFVVPSPPPPNLSISSISPLAGVPGETINNFVVVGTNFIPGITSLSFGEGIVSASSPVISATRITVTIRIDRNATAGRYNIFVKNSSSTAKCTLCFTVTANLIRGHIVAKPSVGQQQGAPLGNVVVTHLDKAFTKIGSAAITNQNGDYFFDSFSSGDFVMPVSSGPPSSVWPNGVDSDPNNGIHGLIFDRPGNTQVLKVEFCKIDDNRGRDCVSGSGENQLNHRIVADFSAEGKPILLTPGLTLQLPVPPRPTGWRIVTEAGGYVAGDDADPAHTDTSGVPGFYALDIVRPNPNDAIPPILAAQAGVVDRCPDPNPDKNFGNCVIVRDDNGYETHYAHLANIAPSLILAKNVHLVRMGNIVTLKTVKSHGLTPGASPDITIRVSGANDATFNGTFKILTVPSETTLTYQQLDRNAKSIADLVQAVVKTGDFLGCMGKTGHTFGIHVHFQAAFNGNSLSGITQLQQIRLATGVTQLSPIIGFVAGNTTYQSINGPTGGFDALCVDFPKQ